MKNKLDISIVFGNAFLLYNQKTGKRILSIKKLVGYKVKLQQYFDTCGFDTEIVGDIPKTLKDYENIWEYVKGDNVIIMHNNVTTEYLRKMFASDIEITTLIAFEDENNLKMLLE